MWNIYIYNKWIFAVFCGSNLSIVRQNNHDSWMTDNSVRCNVYGSSPTYTGLCTPGLPQSGFESTTSCTSQFIFMRQLSHQGINLPDHTSTNTYSGKNHIPDVLISSPVLHLLCHMCVMDATLYYWVSNMFLVHPTIVINLNHINHVHLAWSSFC